MSVGEVVANARCSVLSTRYSVLIARYAAAIILLTPSISVGQEPHAAAGQNPSSDLPTMLFVFMLATFIGLGVITRVSRLLHTPLMSITNAISAIAIVGAIAVAGSEHPFYINLLGAIALFASTTNIVSGFLITDRMLKMFKRA
jgi:H+-translocating NAD(P) transhydrogenase subunit alpha